MRGVLTVAASLALVAALAGQAPESGTITGQVKLTARVRGTPLPSNVYQPRSVANHATVAIPEIKNVVIYLKDVKFKGPLEVSRQEIRQEHETFVPRVDRLRRGVAEPHRQMAKAEDRQPHESGHLEIITRPH